MADLPSPLCLPLSVVLSEQDLMSVFLGMLVHPSDAEACVKAAVLLKVCRAWRQTPLLWAAMVGVSDGRLAAGLQQQQLSLVSDSEGGVAASCLWCADAAQGARGPGRLRQRPVVAAAHGRTRGGREAGLPRHAVSGAHSRAVHRVGGGLSSCRLPPHRFKRRAFVFPELDAEIVHKHPKQLVNVSCTRRVLMRAMPPREALTD